MTTGEGRVALAGALLLYLAFVAYQSLAGGALQPCDLPLADPHSGWYGSDVLQNVVAYVPPGLLAGALVATARHRALKFFAWVPVSAFSLAMELLQSCLSGRVSTWIDWTTNSLGAAIGVLALALVSRVLHAVHEGDAGARRAQPGLAVDSRVAIAAWLVIGAWLAVSTAPWRFTFDVGTVRANLSFLRTVPSLDPWDIARHAFAWMTVAAAIRALVPARRSASVALVVALAVSLGGQALLAWRALSWSELAGAGAGVVVSLVLLAPAANRPLARLLPLFALASVAAYELAPGRARWHLREDFSWWPQLGRGHPLASLDFALFFCWLAFALVLSLRWNAALPTAAATKVARERQRALALRTLVLAVLALFAMEIAQLAIPGRSADTSAPLVAALAFAVAWALTERATAPARPTSHRPAVRSPRRS